MNDYNCLYTRVKQQIVEYIKDLPAGTRLPSRAELIEQFGVTRTTIDRAISELIGEGYFYSKVGSGTYIIDRTDAKQDRDSQSVTSWGLLIPDISHDSYPDTLRGVEDICSSNGINLIVCNTDNDIVKQNKYIKRLISSGVAGMVIVPVITNEADNVESLRAIENENIKFVFCNRGVQGINAPKVVSNDFYGAYAATRHLLKYGWKKPAYLAGPFYSTSEQRYHGYLAALHDNNIIEKDKFVAFAKGLNFNYDEYIKTMITDLLMLPEPPDSVFCFNDHIAESIVDTIEGLGLKVGKDIGIASYDDSDICEKIPVKLTSVRYPKYDIGAKAAEILLDMINGRSYAENYSVVLQPTLIIRESCGEAVRSPII